jgi:hypothetical protein
MRICIQREIQVDSYSLLVADLLARKTLADIKTAEVRVCPWIVPHTRRLQQYQRGLETFPLKRRKLPKRVTYKVALRVRIL